uniref:Uncharacterized protein n=1 Tax=Chromera velia CCMP2878 TaxID=1169474 RepID=A0A0G4I273_9ALVE|eukprot:Cvel_10262.t1-p1 / transcript=Cvel_10262.t1 / gene=Cvel_10262 / organism=Chromera_velia_CCMP2878 / gene_product=hypothetical protein / transcript_product=hypothetical protein / location=Cvel_scaffold615:35943-40405(+) / protein_length=266 / sequence_SO=supercontig / SO=protein_coding / is_pseudo=false
MKTGTSKENHEEVILDYVTGRYRVVNQRTGETRGCDARQCPRPRIAYGPEAECRFSLPHYLTPEMARRDAPDFRTHVFAAKARWLDRRRKALSEKKMGQKSGFGGTTAEFADEEEEALALEQRPTVACMLRYLPVPPAAEGGLRLSEALKSTQEAGSNSGLVGVAARAAGEAFRQAELNKRKTDRAVTKGKFNVRLSLPDEIREREEARDRLLNPNKWRYRAHFIKKEEEEEEARRKQTEQEEKQRQRLETLAQLKKDNEKATEEE